MQSPTQKHPLRRILLLISITTFSIVSTTQAAPPWEQVGKLISPGGRTGAFGKSVSIGRDIVLIGAPSDKGQDKRAGSAYVFNIKTQHLFKLYATDGSRNDQFGHSVSLSGNLAVIGAFGHDDNGANSGSAYVFDITTGRQFFELLPTDGKSGDQFGASVAISGNLAVIGALGDDDNGTDSGSAYVFDVTTGQQLFKLLASDGVANDSFGFPVALDGNLAVIGAIGNDDSGIDSGSAYVFDVTTGQQISKLLAVDGAAEEYFGGSIAVSGNLAVIGTRYDDDNGTRSGSVYVFDLTTGQQLLKLLPSDGAEGDEFGNSIAMDDNLVVVGAVADRDNGIFSGSAYVFDVTTGQQLFKLLANDGRNIDNFGDSVDIYGDLVVIGATGVDNIGFASGAAYFFQQRTTNYLTVEPFPLMAGQDGTFSMVQTLPDEQTWLLYSLEGLGQVFISQLNITIDLDKPKIAIGPRLTDVNGDLQLKFSIPNNPDIIDIWFQAVQHNNVTNFFRTQILP